MVVVVVKPIGTEIGERFEAGYITNKMKVWKLPRNVYFYVPRYIGLQNP